MNMLPSSNKGTELVSWKVRKNVSTVGGGVVNELGLQHVVNEFLQNAAPPSSQKLMLV